MSAERRGPAICNVSNVGEGKDEMTKASIDLQDLRRRIYVKAKAEPSWRFWGLYVHVCKMETLRAAYEMAKKNDGAPGIDGVTFEAIEAQGAEALLEQLRDELTGRTYKPLPARRQEIPKDGGKVRVLSIPAIRDRVVQGALKLILEPVFEADFQPGSFGYRLKRTAHDAIKRVAEAIVQRKTRVLDFDLRAYFDNVRHDRLLGKVAQRVDCGRSPPSVAMPAHAPFATLATARGAWNSAVRISSLRLETIRPRVRSGRIVTTLLLTAGTLKAITGWVRPLRVSAPSCSVPMLPLSAALTRWLSRIFSWTRLEVAARLGRLG